MNSKSQRRFPVTAFCFVVLLALTTLMGCNRRDARFHQAVCGSWIHGTHEMALSPDGRFFERFHPPNGILTYAGTWKIKTGILSFTVTNAVGPEPHEAIGAVDRGRIIEVDNHHLVYKSQGQTIRLSR